VAYDGGPRGSGAQEHCGERREGNHKGESHRFPPTELRTATAPDTLPGTLDCQLPPGHSQPLLPDGHVERVAETLTPRRRISKIDGVRFTVQRRRRARPPSAVVPHHFFDGPPIWRRPEAGCLEPAATAGGADSSFRPSNAPQADRTPVNLRAFRRPSRPSRP